MCVIGILDFYAHFYVLWMSMAPQLFVDHCMSILCKINADALERFVAHSSSDIRALRFACVVLML